MNDAAKPLKLFYVSAGGANLIESHASWRSGKHNPTEVSITFSSQVEAFVEQSGGTGYLVSDNAKAALVRDKAFTIEHLPYRVGRGAMFYVGATRRAIRLVRMARRAGATLAALDSGAIPFFLMGMFRLAGIPVIVILHNTIWAHGFRRHTTFVQRLVARLDAMFFTRVPAAVVAVSPEAARQVDEIAPRHHCPVVETRAQFLPEYFASIPPPPAHGSVAFSMMFIGRVIEAKGVLDIPSMAQWIDQRHRGLVRWTICGRGPDLDLLRTRATACGVDAIVDIRGWTSLEELQHVYANAHASIVPTTSGFAEGLAMTAIEAVLAGRPVVTNPVVPAHELIADACILGRTNDWRSHAEAVLALALDRHRYEKMRAACAGLGDPFLDRGRGLTATLCAVWRDVAPPPIEKPAVSQV